MPQYMLLLYTPAQGGLTPEERQAELPKWFTYTQEMQEAGVMVAGDALNDLDTATTVRVRDHETLVTDGPFAETKEMLAGYYLLDVPDLDGALKWAAKAPNAVYGSVEVRPVVVFDNMPTPA